MVRLLSSNKVLAYVPGESSVNYRMDGSDKPVTLLTKDNRGVSHLTYLSIDEFYAYVRMILRARDALRSVDPNASR